MMTLLLCCCLIGSPDSDAKAALALAFCEADVAPAKPKKVCPCSELCTCGCNEGARCRCGDVKTTGSTRGEGAGRLRVARNDSGSRGDTPPPVSMLPVRGAIFIPAARLEPVPRPLILPQTPRRLFRGGC